MMSQNQPAIASVFNFKDRSVRVIQKDGQQWWVAADVCRILNHTNSRMALRSLDDDEKGVGKVYTPGGKQNLQIINDSGLFSLVLRSNLPEAKAFKRWLTHEVLPQIRKTGGYQITQSYSEALQSAAEFQRKLEAGR